MPLGEGAQQQVRLPACRDASSGTGAACGGCRAARSCHSLSDTGLICAAGLARSSTLAQGWAAIEHRGAARVVELAHPFRDHDGREDVAEEIGDGADLGHEAVDAEQAAQGRRPAGRSTAGRVAASATKPPPVTPAAPFEVKSITKSIASCWPKPRWMSRRLGDEQHRQRHVDRGAVGVEARSPPAAPARRPPREQPMFSSLTIERGIIASLEVALKAISSSSLK